MTTEFHARARAILGAPVTIDAPTGDNFDIQWMPPGPQSPVCFVGDDAKELTFTVLPQHADMFDAMLQKMLSDAAAGNGDMPFIDFNHEDGRASGRPTKFYWGGNDPKTGGIRLKGKWTPSGSEAVQGKEFTRFSPEWYFGKNSEPLAIGPNLGGLVNRAAFKSIQAVAKSAWDVRDNSREGRIARAVAAAVDTMLQKIERVQAKLGLPATGQTAQTKFVEDDAAILARASTPKIGKILHPLPLENHPFLKQAKALAANQGINDSDAQVRLAELNYPLYQEYLASLSKVHTAKVTGKASHNGQEGFLTLVQAKQAGGMSFDQAVDFVSNTRPDLLQAYRGAYCVKAR